MLKSSLLATKLHRPPQPAQGIQRPFLTQRLQDSLNLHRQVTLISAPAGFGKTTCVTQWVSTLDCPVAWLSLDARDDDPGRFFSYFIAALQNIDAAQGQEIVSVLHAGQLPPEEVISATLINDMLALTDRFLLVLDDFHVIQDHFILQFLEQLIANSPPSLHLVLITREDPPLPLARLRANNLLTEIRARDLRFSSQDTARFLEALGLSLSETDLATLESKTEGWVAGLQLAAIALQSALAVPDGSDPSSFIAGLSGSHRFILGYLTEQVLDQQPEEVRQFLLQTAILDGLHGKLCNAVTGRSDGRFLLEQLLNANLFLIPLDDEGQWYRYHHLFADLLRDRQSVLLGEETAVLHRRASHWYAQENMVSEAIQHALSATDYALAVDLLENHAMRFIMQGYAQTVNGWVEVIPEQWQWQSPKTNLAFAWMHLLRGAYAQALPFLERLEEIFSGTQESEQEKHAIKAEWLVMQSLLQNTPTKSLSLANEALEIIPEEDGRAQSLAYFGLATAYQTGGNEKRAVDAYQKAIQIAQAADNLVAEMLSTSNLAVMALERGQLHLAHDIAIVAIDRVERSDSLPPISAVIYGVLSEVHYQWVQIEPAQQYARRALQLSALGGYQSGLINCHVLLSRLCQLEGDLESACREIQKASDQLQVDTPNYVRQESISQQVRLSLIRNQSAAAEMALQREGFSFRDSLIFPDFTSEQGMSHSLGLLYNSGLRFLLYLAENGRYPDRLKAGIEFANRLIPIALQGQKIAIALETYLLRAQMHALLGHKQASQADYANALALAEQEAFIGIFVEQGLRVSKALSRLDSHTLPNHVSPGFVKRILDAFMRLQSSDATHQASPLVEPLSERELDVLRLMADGLKYKEIASQLFISLNTVRYHVKALYGKLNVNNRTQAIKAARQKKIL
mgnify:CR=1 FL=1